MNKVEAALNKLKIVHTKYSRITEESFASEVYFVETSEHPLILKFAHNETKYWRERRTLEFLEEAIPVPRIIDALDPAEGHNGILLMNRLKGSPLKTEIMRSESVSRTCGRLLARLHMTSIPGLGHFQKEGFLNAPFDSWWDYRRSLIFNDWMKPIESEVDTKTLERVRSAFTSYYDKFRDSTNCLIHCDYRSGNILSDKSEITGLIDFESCRTGDPAYDFIKIYEAIGHLKECWSAFLAGYSGIKCLPDLEEKMLYYQMDLNFGFLQWAHLRGEKALFQEKLNKLRENLDSFEKLKSPSM